MEKQIEVALNGLGTSLSESRRLADDIERLSTHFISDSGAVTPWAEKWVQRAYLSYFLPLNTLRVARAAGKASQFGFFKGLLSVHDFGSGLGAAGWALAPHMDPTTRWHHWDISPDALDIHRNLIGSAPTHSWSARDLKSQGLPELPEEECPQTLAVFSYSMVELGLSPRWTPPPEALLIIEPSTRLEGRKLLELRRRWLQDEGYVAWAPCPHQADCPLLVDSERDWCHDRLHWTMPDWFRKISERLPMKNHTLTFSYLALRRKPTPRQKLTGPLDARIVGDELKEKGRTRYLVCTGPKRQFLTWLRRQGNHPALERGDFVSIHPEGVEFREREIRWKSSAAVEVRPLKPDRP